MLWIVGSWPRTVRFHSLIIEWMRVDLQTILEDIEVFLSPESFVVDDVKSRDSHLQSVRQWRKQWRKHKCEFTSIQLHFCWRYNRNRVCRPTELNEIAALRLEWFVCSQLRGERVAALKQTEAVVFPIGLIQPQWLNICIFFIKVAVTTQWRAVWSHFVVGCSRN